MKLSIRKLENGCWEWQRAKDSSGYGMLNLRSKPTRVHRVMALLFHGTPLTAKKTILHSCDNPSCCNPDHLIVGSQKDNMVDCAQKGRIANSKKELCKRGHPLSGDNLYICANASGNPMRVCRACRRERIRLYMRKRRHATSPRANSK